MNPGWGTEVSSGDDSYEENLEDSDVRDFNLFEQDYNNDRGII